MRTTSAAYVDQAVLGRAGAMRELWAQMCSFGSDPVTHLGCGDVISVHVSRGDVISVHVSRGDASSVHVSWTI